MRIVRMLATIMLVFPTYANAVEICSLLTHAKLSLADLAENPLDTENFYFEDQKNLVREGRLRISGRTFEVSYEDFRTVYECVGRRNEPCTAQTEDARFLLEARVDFSIGVVIEMARQTSKEFNPFSRGGVADGGLKVWKVIDCGVN